MTTVNKKLPGATEIVAEITVPYLRENLKGNRETLFHAWTPPELALLREYCPSTYFRICSDKNVKLYVPGFSLTKDEGSNRLERLALQTQSEIATRGSTLDVGIVHGRRDEGTVESKIHQLGRMYSLFRLLDLPTPEKLPKGLLRKGYDLTDILIEIKRRFVTLLGTLPEYGERLETVRKCANLTSAQREKFAYVDMLKQIMGNDLEAVVAYGSSTKEENPQMYDDYDNYIVIKDGSIDRVMESLKNKRFNHPRDGKHIGINVVERRSFGKLNRINHAPDEVRENGIVLYGEVEFPVPTEREVLERGTSYAVLRAKTLKSGAARFVPNPEVMNNKPDLFAFFQKTQRFLMEAALNRSEGLKTRSKATLDTRLREHQGIIFKHLDSEQLIVNAMCAASACATRLLEHYWTGKEFRADFLRMPLAA